MQFLLLVVYEVAAFDGFRGLLAVSSVCVWEVFPVLWNKLFRVAFLKQILTSLQSASTSARASED